jgi:hypothetical protein
MTKFEELNQIYTKAEKDFKDYRWKCLEMAIELGKGLADYLECDHDEIQYYRPPDKEGKAIEAHPRDALLIDTDTAWHYGMGVNLYVENNKDNPAMTYIFDIALKKDNGNFAIRFDKEKKEFSLDTSKPEDFNQIYDFIFNIIKNRFEQELTKFLEHKSSEHFPEYG